MPRSAPNWTDHNTHDPGITLLQLIAYTLWDDLQENKSRRAKQASVAVVVAAGGYFAYRLCRWCLVRSSITRTQHQDD